jgi:signal transduction histidine kinase
MPPRLLRFAIFCGTWLVLGGIIAGTVFLLGRLRENAENTAREAVLRLAKIAEGTVNRQFLQVDAALAGLPALFNALPNAEDQAAAMRLLRQVNFRNLGFRDLLLLHHDGTLWASALPDAFDRRPPLEDALLRRAQGSPSVLTSGPTRNPVSGDWSLYFLREVKLQAQGPMLAVAEMPIAVLTELLAPLSDQSKIWVMLETVSGRLLTIVPPDEEWIGRSFDQPPSQRLPPDGQPHLIASRFTGDPVIAAAHASVFRDILVVTGYTEARFLAGFRTHRRNLLLGAAGAGLLTLTLGLGLFAGLRSQLQLAEERTAARALLERAIESLPDGFVMWDRDDRMVICNQRYRELYAVSAPFIRPGVSFAELVREGAKRGQYPQAGSDLDAFVDDVVAWHRSNRPPMERLLPDGTWLLATERRLPGGGTVGIHTDIIDFKRTYIEMSTARDAAATKAKSRFLARMSHELRTPLNAVMGLAQLLAGDQALSGEQRERARTLEQAARHAVGVADSVLDLAQVEAGQFELRNETVALRALLEACLALFEADAKTKQIALSADLVADLPIQIVIDSTRLRQVLLNLLSNAVKFTPPKGCVELRARLLPSRGSGETMLRLEVRDNGPGIPASMRQAIFDDFIQLSSQDDGGTGLGLAISAEIIHRMLGRIGCEANDDSAPPTGAVFWIELPMNLPDDATGRVSPQAAPQARRGLSILVADDVPTNLAVARALLESGGHNVTVAADGSQALEEVARAAAEQRPYDVVLMDVMMPGMDGLEAAKRIRALPGPVGRTPILAVTASAFAEDIDACLTAGMDGHLPKPIERDRLLSAVGRLAGEAPPAAAPPAPSPGIALPPALVVPGLDAAASAALAEAFLAEIRAARTALAEATEPAGMVAAAHRLAGAAATLSLGPLADAARGFQRGARELAAAERTARRDALLALAEATLQTQAPTS